jgi:ATP-binding cassette subfamily F protein 3
MVLRADVWREHLLEKERDLTSRINAVEAEQADDEEELTEEDKKALEIEKDRLNTELKEVFTKLTDIESDKAESKASAILAGLGFDNEQQKRPTREFSGGWRMRISLARALFCKPDVLMLDEPDNMLDVSMENHNTKHTYAFVLDSCYCLVRKIPPNLAQHLACRFSRQRVLGRSCY